jgi:hypothetical protein
MAACARKVYSNVKNIIHLGQMPLLWIAEIKTPIIILGFTEFCSKYSSILL